MKKSIEIFYKTHDYILLAPLHKSPLKTLQLITTTFIDIRKPILCESARQLPVTTKFKTSLIRL